MVFWHPVKKFLPTRSGGVFLISTTQQAYMANERGFERALVEGNCANEAPMFSTVVGVGDFGGDADLLTITSLANSIARLPSGATGATRQGRVCV